MSRGKSTGAYAELGIGPKLLEMLRGMAPKVTRVAVLVNPSNLSHAALLKNVHAAAPTLGVKVQTVEASTSQAIANGFTAMARQNAGALIVSLDQFFIQQRKQIAELAAKQRLPSISAFGEYVEAGGLMSYGARIIEMVRRAATYADKIFKGANPGDKFELAVNLKTAKALCIKVSQSILIQATKVIE